LKKSDLVVIANALKTVTVPNTDSPPKAGIVRLGDHDAAMFQQVETTFHIRAVVKGQLPDKRLTLVHFRWKSNDELRKEQKPSGDWWDGMISVENGPGLVEFASDGGFVEPTRAGVVKAGPDCLLFLKLRKDGKYQPVSGQVDPEYSVRWLTETAPAMPGDVPPHDSDLGDHARSAPK
jgi:hypothetical protein